MPCSWAVSMMPCATDSSVCGPKFMVPRQRREPVRPVRPRWVNSIAPILSPASSATRIGRDGHVQLTVLREPRHGLTDGVLRLVRRKVAQSGARLLDRGVVVAPEGVPALVGERGGGGGAGPGAAGRPPAPPP